MKPENFILNSDYATLKNDDTDSVSVTLTSKTLANGETYSSTQDLAMGTVNASSRVRISSSKDSNDTYAGSVFIANRTGTVPGPFSAPYDVVAYITRVNATTIRATVAITNPYASTLAMASGSEVMTFNISTFLSPFV